MAYDLYNHIYHIYITILEYTLDTYSSSEVILLVEILKIPHITCHLHL